MINFCNVFIRFTPLAALLVLLSVVGCAPKLPPGTIQETPEAAWRSFRDNYCAPTEAPGVLISASLRYTRVVPTRRTNLTRVSMWGNFDGAMRLDIAAGIGKLLAHIRENSDGLLVYYPSENIAYAHINPVLGATRLGMPFPFSLNTLARVTMGDFSELAPKKFGNARQDGDHYIYEVNHGSIRSITLDKAGHPIIIEGTAPDAYEEKRIWQLSVERYGDEPLPLPGRVVLTMDDGEQGVLRVKSRELKTKAWPNESTDLELPEGALIKRLDNGYTSIKQ